MSESCYRIQPIEVCFTGDYKFIVLNVYYGISFRNEAITEKDLHTKSRITML